MEKVGKQNVGFGKSVPPQWQYVKIYFVQKGLTEQAAKDFFQEQKNRKWKSENGIPVSNWKVLANDWIWNYTQAKRLRSKMTKLFWVESCPKKC